jgi:Mor family transcriptional regulator
MNKMDKWISRILDRIAVEDLPESYRDVAGIIGIENTIKLSNVLGGLAYYFPQLDKALIKKRDELIRSEFTGANHKPLAIKYGLTEVWIRAIVQRPRPTTASSSKEREKRS